MFLPSNRTRGNIFTERTVIIVLLFVSLALKLVFFTGFQDDDIYYASGAQKISKSGAIDFFGRDYVGGLRLGLLLPTALFFLFFKVSPYSAALFPILCSFGFIIVLYFLGKELFDKKSGICAALLYVFFPLDTIYSTSLYPDLPAALFIGLSVLIFIKGQNYSDNRGLFLSWLSGIILGAAYLIKEVALLAILLYAVIIINNGKNKRIIQSVAYFILGLAIIMVVEIIYLRLASGVWINNLVATSHLQTGLSSFVAYEREASGLTRYLHWMFISVYQTGLFFYALLFYLTHLFFRKLPNKRIAIGWFLIFLLFLEFGSTSLLHYNPLPKQPRYLLFLAMPMFLIIGSSVSAPRKGIAKLLLRCGVIFLCLTAIICLFINDSMLHIYEQPVKDTYNMLRTLPAKRIYVSWDYYYKLRAYFKFEKDTLIIPFSKKKSLSLEERKRYAFHPQGDSYVVNNLWRSAETSIFYPDQLNNSFSDWRKIARIDTILSKKKERVFRFLEILLSKSNIPKSVKFKIIATIKNLMFSKITLIYYIP